MKNLIAFLLFISLLACSDKKEIKTTSEDTSTKISSKLIAPPKVDGFYINYNFNKGDIYKYKINTLSSTSQELVSDSVVTTKTELNVEYRVKLVVVNVDTNRIAKIDLLIESIIVNGLFNGQEISYDSKYIYSTQERMMFAQYEAIKKKKFRIDINSTGEILKVYNIDSIIAELLSIQQLTNSVSAQQKRELRNEFSTSSLRPLSEQIFRKFPSEKVAVNYSWSEKYYSEFALFKIENIANFQLSDVDTSNNDSVLVFNAGLSINFIGERNASEQGMDFYFYDPVVSGGGTIKFSKSKGLVVYSKTSTSMEMETDISGIDQNSLPIKAKRTDNTSNTNIVELLKYRQK
ncbi:MAG: DUF6263 family protein [Melioribacteraceae bacterium]|nr:DUF6263 family protein [Melioribacteraceae bacterium]